jgi:molecular chaperone GrpE
MLVSDDKYINNNESEEMNGDNSVNVDDTDDLSDEAELVEQDIKALRQEAENNHEKLLRLAAEFENYKKRMERERATTLKYAGEDIFRELLPSIDNLERAIEQGNIDSEDLEKKIQGLIEGIELTKKGLLATLEKFEVFPIKCIGRQFDPNEQEAMAMEPSKTVPANHVTSEFVKGYRFKDRLLRPAKVIVSRGSE